MSKRFRCGRAILTNDGTVKKLSLGKGGGSRFCDWYDNDMNFDEVRHRLINLFNLGDTEHEILLYDYQLRPLDLDQYETVLEYVYANGLNCNSTVIYLCTREVENDQSEKKIVKKKKKESSNKRSSLSSTSIEYKPVIKIEPDSHSKQTHPSSFGNWMIIIDSNIQVLSLDYSFKNTTGELVKYVRDLINQNPGDEILIRLFEDCCIIHGHVCAIIDPLQRNLRLQLRTSSEQLDRLNDIEHIYESIETLLNLNKEKLNQLENFPIINDLFVQFSQNLKNFPDQWIPCVGTNNESQATSTYSNKQSSSDDQTDTYPRRPDELTCNVFQPLLNSATDLLDIMDPKRLATFRAMIKWFITDLEFIRSNVDLHNYQSLCDAKQAVNSLKIRYTRKFNDKVLKSTIYQFTRSVKQVHQKTLRAICDLLTTLRQYQLQIDEQDQPSKPKSSLSSTSSSKTRQEQSEDSSSIRPKKIKLEKFETDPNNRIDTAVYSSSDIQ